MIPRVAPALCTQGKNRLIGLGSNRTRTMRKILDKMYQTVCKKVQKEGEKSTARTWDGVAACVSVFAGAYVGLEPTTACTTSLPSPELP